LVLVELRFHGANPFVGVSYGATPLHISSFNGNCDCVHLLLSWGADINHRTTEGCTALHYAAYMGKPEVVRMLLHLGCDYKAKCVGHTLLSQLFLAEKPPLGP
jgi:ankyrin repeat protein